MNFQKLMTLLLRDDVYDSLKEHEEEIFLLLPELKVCKGFHQKNKWHIYDVYEHILHVVAGVEASLVLRLTALFHDLGKPLAFTVDEEGVGHFYGHWDRSVELFRKYEPMLNLPREKAQLIRWLIFYHDVNVDMLTQEELEQMIKSIGKQNLKLLFAMKRSDLMAQNPIFHGHLANIQTQEKRLLEE